MQDNICPKVLIIEPESNQWLPLSLTHSLTDSLINSCFVDLIHVLLTCEDTNSNLVEVVKRFKRFKRFIHRSIKILSRKKLVECWIPGETLVGFQTLS